MSTSETKSSSTSSSGSTSSKTSSDSDTIVEKKETMKDPPISFEWAHFSLEDFVPRLEEAWKNDFESWHTSSRAEIRFHRLKWGKLDEEFRALRTEFVRSVSVLKDAATIMKDYSGLLKRCDTLLDNCSMKILLAEDDLASTAPTNLNSSSSGQTDTPKFQFKLDRIKLPKFSGKFSEWEEFRDLFVSAVDKNPTLSGAEKIVYLKTSLSGEALAIIQSFKSTESAYTDAWQEVLRRYSNPREIVFSHIRKFDDLPKCHDSAHDIRKVTDHLNELIRSLKSHQVPVEHWDIVLIFLALKKLDSETKKEWLLTQDIELPKLSEFISFLEKRARALADVCPKKTVPAQKASEQVLQKKERFKSVFATEVSSEQSDVSSTTNQAKCNLCGQSHRIHQCDSFKNLSVSDRYAFIKKNGRCFNCLAYGHKDAECKSKFTCSDCAKRHHSLLHKDLNQSSDSSKPTAAGSSKPKNSDPSPPSADSSQSFHTSSQFNCQILLETAVVSALNTRGEPVTVRVFVDKGSQIDLITENCVNKLGLPRSGKPNKILGLGGTIVGNTRGKVDVTLLSKVNNYSLSFSPEIVDKVTSGSLPSFLGQSKFPHLQGLKLADPKFYEPRPVDVMLGARFASVIKTGGFIPGPKGTPSAEETQFGWLLSGPLPSHMPERMTNPVHHSNFHLSSLDTPSLDKTLEKFWELEEAETLRFPRSIEDSQCETYFKETTVRDDEGRYVVSLPFRESRPELGSSLSMATRRFCSVESRMSKNPVLKSEYLKYFEEHIALGIMESIPTDELKVEVPLSYYMPYTEVLKQSSSTTKFRVVYDCSAKTFQGPSLNEVLLPGPKLQVDLISLLIRFRLFPVAISADISKFFNQIGLSKEHQDYQRLVFREDPSVPLRHFRMKRLTFGVTSSPYLASRALHQLFDDECVDPSVIDIVKNDTLVDNVLSGAFTIPRALDIQQELLKTASKGKLDLRKWASNVPQLLEQIPVPDREVNLPLKISDEYGLPTLGVKWNPSSDTFSMSIPEFDSKVNPTKRSVLSVIARIFDPLGWLSPVTIRPKLLLQELWKSKCDWDTPLPPQFVQKWNKIQSDLPLLSEFEIPRCYSTGIFNPGVSDPELTYELFGFSDASNVAYSAVVYIRCSDPKGNSTVYLVGAKTKVAPVKGDTIPRLELNGARLLSNFVKTISSALPIKLNSITCFTDSTSVLGQLNPNSKEKQSVFVMNRVRAIQNTLPNAAWCHVSGRENPADAPSRGISAQDFLLHPVWINGPTWLTQGPSPEPAFQVCAATFSYSSVIYYLTLRMSSYTKLIRVTAFVLRFIQTLKTKQRITGHLTAAELESALETVVRSVQSVTFSEELKNLTSTTTTSIPKKIKFLSPFVDGTGILRVGGRLSNSNLKTGRIHPILLPKNHRFSFMVARYYHLLHLHAGPNLLLCLIREKFWIVGGPTLVKVVVKRCVTCHKANPKPLEQIMSDLPSARVTLTRPFAATAMDFAGPFHLAVTTGRKPRIIKSYFCVFVCMATKAVHIELVGDLSTPSFIASLQRFTARRGRPASLLSDGGKNFVGAYNEMKAVLAFLQSSDFNQSLVNHCAERGIEVHINPPLSPHHGGLFEAAVKSVKHHLTRVVQDRHLTIEEFNTILIQIEAVLNSRPLTQMSTDPNDFSALTPAHFLIGGPLHSIPMLDLTEAKEYSLSRWQKSERIYQEFVKRFHVEYLSLLQSRPKWLKSLPNLEPGVLVLVRESDATFSSSTWKLARITQVFPGLDGKVRVVEIKSPTGKFYRRPIVKIAPLPVTD